MITVKLFHGDCFKLFPSVPDSSVDMVLTDPPYSSGGLFAGDRKSRTSAKYTDTDYNGASRFEDFSGDNMDQMSFMLFMRMVLSLCREKTKPAGTCAVFVDWRNLAAMINALQTAGWIYRGIVVWDKGTSRAIPNRFRNDCEYIVWGTNGYRKTEYKPGVWVGRGCYHISIVSTKKKHHQTEKPVELLENLLAITAPGDTVLDPFMGSGSTGVACMKQGRNFTGFELSSTYFETACDRILKEQERFCIYRRRGGILNAKQFD